MKNFTIKINADLSKIKSLLKKATEEMDLLNNFVISNFTHKYNRRFVSRSDGNKLIISVIYYNSYFNSPILIGEFKKSTDNNNSINFSFNFHPFQLFLITIISIAVSLMLIDIFKSSNLLIKIIIPMIIIFGIIYEIVNFISKIHELKHFVFNIYGDMEA